MRFVMLFLAIAPAIIWQHFFWERGAFKVNSESLLIALAIGATTAFPAISVAMLIEGISFPFAGLYFQAFTDAFLKAAVPEEAFKFVGVYLCLYRVRDEIRSPYDIVVLAVAVSIGFAALENMFYVDGSINWTGTVFWRSLTAVPGHAFTGAIMGTFIAQARLRRAPGFFLIAALLVPILLHGLYDYFLFLEQSVLLQNLTGHAKLTEYAELAFILTVCGEGALSIAISGALLRNPHHFNTAPLLDMTPLILKKWQQAFGLRFWLWRILSVGMIVSGLTISIFIVADANGDLAILFGTNQSETQSKLILAIGLSVFSVFHGITFLMHSQEIKKRGTTIEASF